MDAAKHHTMHRMDPPRENGLVQNASSAEEEKPVSLSLVCEDCMQPLRAVQRWTPSCNIDKQRGPDVGQTWLC